MQDNRTVGFIERANDDDAFAATLAQAFQNDPAMAWIVQDPDARRIALPKLFKILIRSDRRSGWVLGSAKCETATLWRAPSNAHAPMSEMIMEGPALIGAFGLNLARALTLSDGIEGHHPQSDDYWYLHIAGVAPSHQGKGWGGIAIREGLARASAQGKAVLLETATPSNVPLYQRLGFVVTHEWDAPKGGPHFWTMRREADAKFPS
jgi:ribosomal protein S18 acetylase RimI-like enzyme